jgi:hypothetical protein
LEPTVRGTLVLGDVRDVHKHRLGAVLSNASPQGMLTNQPN